jgi:hypothetical protein
MKPVTTPDQEAALLRAAVTRADFQAAEDAAARYVDVLRPLIAGLPSTDAMQQLRGACDLMDWSLRNLSAARVRLIDEVRRLDILSRYHARLAEAARMG